jgi:RNA polymerase sigma-70 factor (ECF subfamily)
MDEETLSERLSRIQTCWSQVCQAHEGPTVAKQSAQHELLARYGGAVKRYLLGGVRDAEAADELFQDFAIRFLKGDLKGADRQLGKFRNYLRGVLFHMVADHNRKRAKQPRQLATEHPEPEVADPCVAESDPAFLASWRDELLARAWNHLAEVEKEKDQPFFSVLRVRAEHPQMRSEQLAHELTSRLARELTPANTRQLIHRARERFAEFLLEDVAHSLEVPSAERLEEELSELGLLEYCRPALEQRYS